MEKGKGSQMLFTKYPGQLCHAREIDDEGAARLAHVLRERHMVAYCLDLIRFGYHERQLIDEILEELAPLLPNRRSPFAQTRGSRLEGEFGGDRTPREIYESEVMPRVRGERERRREAGRSARIGPLRQVHAREVAFCVLDDLQAECALVAMGAEKREDALEGATQTAILAEQLFGEPVHPSMVDDWGQGQLEDPANATVVVPHRPMECIGNGEVFHFTAHELRVLLDGSPEEMGSLAFDVWDAHNAILHEHASQASPYRPSWWMRPTPLLPEHPEIHALQPDVVFEPLEVPGDERDELDIEVDLLTISPSAARGLAAVCGMLLTRLARLDNPGCALGESRYHGEPVNTRELAKLHLRLLDFAGLL